MTAADGLSGRQVETLIDALIAGYPAHEELEMLLYIELEKRSLLAIAGTGGLRSCVFRLVRAADSEGWLPELIIAAVERRPRCAELRAWIAADGHALGPVMTAADLTSQAPSEPRHYELLRSMSFDLVELHRVALRAVKEPSSHVVGFATRYPDDVFVGKLCEWLEANLSDTKRKDPLPLFPEFGPVPGRLHALARYRRDLDSADVLCTVHAEGVPADRIAEFWEGVGREFTGITRRLVLVFVCDSSATCPADVIELPLPWFEVTDIDMWTREIARMYRWPVELADAWTALLCEESMYDGALDVRGLYEAMDRSINDVRYRTHSFRQQLEGRVGYADAP